MEPGAVDHTGCVAADQQRRQREAEFVDQSGIVQLPVEVGSSFGEHDPGAAPSQRLHGLDQVDAITVEAHHLGDRLGPAQRAGRRGTGGQQQRRLIAREQIGVEVEVQMARQDRESRHRRSAPAPPAAPARRRSPEPGDSSHCVPCPRRRGSRRRPLGWRGTRHGRPRCRARPTYRRCAWRRRRSRSCRATATAGQGAAGARRPRRARSGRPSRGQRAAIGARTDRTAPMAPALDFAGPVDGPRLLHRRHRAVHRQFTVSSSIAPQGGGRTVPVGIRRGAVGRMVADVSHFGGFDSTCGGQPDRQGRLALPARCPDLVRPSRRMYLSGGGLRGSCVVARATPPLPRISRSPSFPQLAF